MEKVSFLFVDDSYEVAQILDNKNIIVFANRIDINSGDGSIFLMSLNVKDSDDDVIRGHLSPLTTTLEIAKILSSNLNDYLNSQEKKGLWLPSNLVSPDFSARFQAKAIKQANGEASYGIVWQGISTPGWSTDNIRNGTPKLSTSITISLNNAFDFWHEKPGKFEINDDIIYPACQILEFRGR